MSRAIKKIEAGRWKVILQDPLTVNYIIEGEVSGVLDKKDGRVLLQINCNQDILLSLISIKSFQLLQLALNKKIYIQVKAVVTRGN